MFCQIHSKKSLFILLTACLIAVYGPFAGKLQTTAISNQTSIILTNIERADKGLSPLIWNGALASSAWLKAQDMCTRDYWAHTAPDGGSTGWTFMQQSGYEYVTAGENLAKNFTDDASVVQGWMASPGHRAAILNAEYVDAGIATISCVRGGVSATLVVAHYGATQIPNFSSKYPTITKSVVSRRQSTMPDVHPPTYSSASVPVPTKKF